MQNPAGGDVDNLAKPVLDALKPALLRGPGGDGAIEKLVVTKRPAKNGRHGVWITISPVKVPSTVNEAATP